MFIRVGGVDVISYVYINQNYFSDPSCVKGTMQRVALTRLIPSLGQLRTGCSRVPNPTQVLHTSPLNNYNWTSQSLCQQIDANSQRFTSFSCGATPSGGSAGVPTASCKEAYDLINSGFKYLDVRTPEEYAGGHIAGSVNVPVWVRDESQQMVPNEAFVRAVEERFPDKEGVKLCVGCLSGKRSDAATTLLANAGYSNLVDMSAGFQGWCGEGLPTEQ